MNTPAPLTHILFLDIVGVLNSTRTILAHNGQCGGEVDNFAQYLDPIALKLLRSLSDRGVTFVLFSSWRDRIRNKEDLEAFSKELGIPIHSTTPTYPDGRGLEIQAWFAEQRIDPETVKYVILEDAGHDEEQRAYLVQTDGEEGFLYRDYLVVCKILKLDPYPTLWS